MKRLLVSVLSLGISLAGVNIAFAGTGRSPYVGNCYARWQGQEAWGVCEKALGGQYRVTVQCSGEFDPATNWIWIGKGSSIDGFGAYSCTWGATSAKMQWKK